jgi:hypothetical protein
MNEEEQTDQKLSDLAESCINEATEDSEEEEPMERSAASKRATSLRVASRRK